MNMTGDPNQRNQPAMFGIEGSFMNPTLNMTQANEAIVSVDPGVSSRTQPVNETVPPLVNNRVPFALTNYVFPSTSTFEFLPPTSRFAFTLPQASSSTEMFGRSSESSISPQDVNPFVGSSTFNWTPNGTPFSSVITSTTNTLPSTSNSFMTRPLSGMFGCKRKTASPPLPPMKQHITEERMAEHMSRLHISSQTPTASNESKPIRERRLFMCEEMQRLQTESIIPAQILERVNRPCTALVPWRPPIVPPIVKENNNNEEETDNNLMVEESEDSAAVDMMES